MARPLVLAAYLALGLPRSAAAGGHARAGTNKVTIETDPPGAKVYFNVKEDGEVCTTPCTIDAPIGETPILIEAENRRPIIENLVVPKKPARPIRVSYKLKPALGTLVIEGSDGATITIDEQDQGTAPRRFEDILAGAHHVVLQKGGKRLYDGFVEVEIGREASVSAPRLAAEPPPAHPQGESPALQAFQPAPAGAPRRSPAIAVKAASDIAFRQFSFHHPGTATQVTQHDYREAGEVMTGAIVELWPTTLLRLRFLPGLALHGRFEIGVNPQRVTVEDSRIGVMMPTTLTTVWRSLEISVRQRWALARAVAIEAGAGYTDDRYRFTSEDPRVGPNEQATVPDASYKAVRIGGRASLRVGRLEPYLAAEGRIVLSGGALEQRYSRGASILGYRGELGAAVHLGRFEVRAGGSVTLYSWTFRPALTDADQADNGKDVIEQIGLAVGYAY